MMIKRTRPGTYKWNMPRSTPFVVTAVMLTIWVGFGGNAPDGIVPFALLALSGSMLLGLMMLGGARESWRSLAWPARAMILFFVLVPLIQLVPLPPAIWHDLPGRALATGTLAAAGLAQAWHPITLAVGSTFRTLLIFIWLATLLLALLRLSSNELRWIFGILLILGLLNVAIGIVQIASGGTVLQLYDNQIAFFLNGLFANKNHAGLFIALTYLTGYTVLYANTGWHRRNIALVTPVGVVLLVALLATFSRAGMMFGLAALGFLTWLSFVSNRTGSLPSYGATRRRYLLIAFVVIGMGLLAAIASTSLAASVLARFGGVDDDLRWSFWQWSWPLVNLYFPFGSGIGSFTTVFPPHEQLAWVKPTYVNHAHNDYLEQLIEIGVAAPVGWVLTASAMWYPIQTAWRERTRPSGRMALVGTALLVLIGLHSVFDYPLRRPAIAATAIVAMAALLRIAGKSGLQGPTRYARDAATIG